MLALWLTVCLLLAGTYAVLQSSRVQDYLVHQVTRHLSSELNTEISVGGVDVFPFRSIVLKDVRMKDQNGEDFLEVDRMVFVVKSISFRERKLHMRRIHFENAYLGIYRTEEDEVLNVQFLLDYFDTSQPRSRPGLWEVECSSFRLADVDFQYRDLTRPYANGEFSWDDFYFEGIYLAVREVKWQEGALGLELDHLRFREPQGFDLQFLAGNFQIGNKNMHLNNVLLRTSSSEIRMDAHLSYPSSGDIVRQPGDVYVDVFFRPSRLAFADVGIFYAPLFGKEEAMNLSGNISGQLGDFTGRSVFLSLGDDLSFGGEFRISGLPETDELNLDVSVESLIMSYDALHAISLSSISEITEDFSSLQRLGRVHYSGDIQGSLSDLHFEGLFATGAGNLFADLRLSWPGTWNAFSYGGNISLTRWDLGRVLDAREILGKTELTLGVQGKGLSGDAMEFELGAMITSLDAMGYGYRNLQFSAFLKNMELSIDFMVNDPNLDLELQSRLNMQGPFPVLDFRADIRESMPSALNLFRTDLGSFFSGQVVVEGRGQSLADFEGYAVVRDVLYEQWEQHAARDDRGTQRYLTDSIYVRNTRWDPRYTHLMLRSDFMDADIQGFFNLDQMGLSVKHFIQDYLPSFRGRQGMAEKVPTPEQEMAFSLRLKDIHPLSELFFPVVSVGHGAWMSGDYSSHNKGLVMQAHADTLVLAGRRFTDLHLSSGATEVSSYEVFMDAKKLFLTDSLYLDRFTLNAELAEDSMIFYTHWLSDDTPDENRGDMEGVLHFAGPGNLELQFLSSSALVGGALWEISPGHKLMVDSSRVEVQRFMMHHGDQFVYAHGVLGPQEGDRMNLSFANLDMAIVDVVFGKRDMELAGILEGNVAFTGVFQPPSIEAEVFVTDFVFNGEPLGYLQARSLWDESLNGFVVEAIIERERGGDAQPSLMVNGFMNTGDELPVFDLAMDVHRLSVFPLSNYMKGFTDAFKGFATGQLQLKGPVNRPELTGHLDVEEGSFFVNFLNTTYYYNHGLDIRPDGFHFSQMVLADSLGNTALSTGSVMHNHLKGFSLDVRIQPNQLALLNTTARHNDMFYGAAFLSGLAHIYGPANDLTLDISAITNRGTRIYLPLSASGEVRENHFISFVSREIAQENPVFDLGRTGGNVTLNFDLEVTPDAEVQLMFESRFGDIIRGRGNADLRMEVAPGGLFNIYGDYSIEDGEYFFNLQNIINKRFRIEQGSSISWTGDINDASVDMRGAYRLRTPLYDLLVGEGVDVESAELYRRRVPVETILVLEDKLFNPNISFDIELPGGDENTRELIERVITTEQEMNRQVFSLMVLNRFLPTTTDQYNTALGYGFGNTSTELLSNQLSNWLSQISTEFDIGINYRPGDEISSQEVELALSTQLFDDRVSIDGNLGVAGSETATGQATQRASHIIGDVNVEVKITPEGKFRIKAFNRSNNFDILRTNSPYTQGIGLFYRKEFDSLQELFRKSAGNNGFNGDSSNL